MVFLLPHSFGEQVQPYCSSLHRVIPSREPAASVTCSTSSSSQENGFEPDRSHHTPSVYGRALTIPFNKPSCCRCGHRSEVCEAGWHRTSDGGRGVTLSCCSVYCQTVLLQDVPKAGIVHAKSNGGGSSPGPSREMLYPLPSLHNSPHWHGAGRCILSFLAGQTDQYLPVVSSGRESSSLGGAAGASTAAPGSTSGSPGAPRAAPHPSPAPRAPGAAHLPRLVSVTLKLKRRQRDLSLIRVVVRSMPLSVLLSVLWAEPANQCGPVSL